MNRTCDDGPVTLPTGKTYSPRNADFGHVWVPVVGQDSSFISASVSEKRDEALSSLNKSGPGNNNNNSKNSASNNYLYSNDASVSEEIPALAGPAGSAAEIANKAKLRNMTCNTNVFSGFGLSSKNSDEIYQSIV